jgi:hypothetical protein
LFSAIAIVGCQTRLYYGEQGDKITKQNKTRTQHNTGNITLHKTIAVLCNNTVQKADIKCSKGKFSASVQNKQ